MYTRLEDVLGKVDWEGGLYDTAFGYGLSAEAIDKAALPELHEAWLQMESAHRLFEPAFDRVQKILDEADVNGW